jgi:uncharacterized protein
MTQYLIVDYMPNKTMGPQMHLPLLLAVLLSFGFSSTQTSAQSERSNGERSERSAAARANAGTVTVISGTVSGTFIQIANDLSFVLDDGDRLRVIPMIGKGAQQNLYDILFLKGVDLGIVRSDGLEELQANPETRRLSDRIAFITRLFTDEAHLIAREGIDEISQLQGKKVNFDLLGSGANYSGRLIFERLGIDIDPVNVDQPAAYEMLARGEIDAIFQMSGKPIPAIAKLEPGGAFKLIGVPYDPRIADLYLPAVFTAEDYPNLVPDQSVDTVAVSSILAVYNWPEKHERYDKVARFVNDFFDKIGEFQKPPRHPKWSEVNVGADVPGWARFKAAQDWLDENAATATASSRDAFDQFMRNGDRKAVEPEQREALFREFLEWERSRSR